MADLEENRDTGRNVEPLRPNPPDPTCPLLENRGLSRGAPVPDRRGRRLAGRGGRGAGRHRFAQHRRYGRRHTPGPHAAARRGHSDLRAYDRVGSAAGVRLPLHRRPAQGGRHGHLSGAGVRRTDLMSGDGDPSNGQWKLLAVGIRRDGRKTRDRYRTFLDSSWSVPHRLALFVTAWVFYEPPPKPIPGSVPRLTAPSHFALPEPGSGTRPG